MILSQCYYNIFLLRGLLGLQPVPFTLIDVKMFIEENFLVLKIYLKSLQYISVDVTTIFRLFKLSDSYLLNSS